jgi:hypothetical protein
MFLRLITVSLVTALLGAAAGCGGGSSTAPPPVTPLKGKPEGGLKARAPSPPPTPVTK